MPAGYRQVVNANQRHDVLAGAPFTETSSFSSPLAERAQGVSTTTCVHQSSLPNGLVETKLLAPFSHNAAMDGPVQASDSAFSPKLGGDSFKSGLANSALDQAPQVLEEERPKGERPGLPLNDPRGREWIKGQDFWTSSQMEGDLPRMRRNT